MKEFSSALEWVESLREEKIPVVVEGPNDRKALEMFGVTDIVTLSRTPLYEVVDSIAARSKRVILLTDLDRKGKQLYGRLRRSFEREGVEVDRTYREWLFKNTELAQIEGLATYVRHEGERKP